MVVEPMMAVAAPLPTRDEQAFGAEWKWDGVRAAAYVQKGALRLVSRNLRDITPSYPDLADLGALLAGRQVVLDGEIVAFNEAGRPDFGTLQARMHVRQPSPQVLAAVPVVFVAFDVLHLDGWSTLRMSYVDRRGLLDQIDLDTTRVQVPPYFLGNASAAFRTAREQALEGVVCKRLDSPYLPGRRSDLWRKTKVTATQEVVIGGWKPGRGRRAGMIGSLLVGVPDDQGHLIFAGGVGTGFTDAMLRDLMSRLQPLTRSTSPFASEIPRSDARDAQWVDPRLVGEVEFAHWTNDNLLRHPAWRGLRLDKRPRDVKRE